MNAKAFFSIIKKDLFSGSLTQGIVDTINQILAACDKYGVYDYRDRAYCLATAYHESYSKAKNPDWDAVREGWAVTNQGAINAVTSLFSRGIISRNYALPHANGHSYYGRAFVQLTHGDNYKTMGRRLGIDLYSNPDLALQKQYAAEILVLGLKEGLFTGKKLSQYFTSEMSIPIEARRMVNGTDKAEAIAGHFTKFYNAIAAL